MNKAQYIKLLRFRGITKLLPGESMADAIERSGGQPTFSEIRLLNLKYIH